MTSAMTPRGLMCYKWRLSFPNDAHKQLWQPWNPYTPLYVSAEACLICDSRYGCVYLSCCVDDDTHTGSWGSEQFGCEPTNHTVSTSVDPSSQRLVSLNCTTVFSSSVSTGFTHMSVFKSPQHGPGGEHPPKHHIQRQCNHRDPSGAGLERSHCHGNGPSGCVLFLLDFNGGRHPRQLVLWHSCECCKWSPNMNSRLNVF